MASKQVTEEEISKKLNFYRESIVGDPTCEDFDDLITDFFGNEGMDYDDSEDESTPNINDCSFEESDSSVGGLLDLSLGLDDDDAGLALVPHLLQDEENLPPIPSNINPQMTQVNFTDPINDMVKKDVIKFKCKCKARCSDRVGPQALLENRLEMIAVDRNTKDWIVMTAVQSGIHNSEMTECSRWKNQKRREHSRVLYRYKDFLICRETFKFMYAISQDKLSNVKKNYLENGFCPIFKKSAGAKNCKKAMDFKELLFFSIFMKRYAGEHGLMLPGRIPGLRRSDADTLLLSCSETKRNVCSKFNAARQAINADAPEIKYRTFCRYWKSLFPNIVIAKPRSDLCRTCQVNTTNIASSGGSGLLQKRALITTAQDHLELAFNQRDVYNRMIVESKECLQGMTLGHHQALIFNGRAHYAFDFAQQILYPSDPLQAGPIYFLVPRKCQVFGICCTGLTKQINYLIDEAQIIKKGSEFVVNLLHHFLENWGLGETSCDFHCDNCCAQNKNQFMIAYLMWRVMTNRHKEITLNFMLAGHTKFLPDGGFGQIKQRLRVTKVECMEEIAAVVNSSSKMNAAQIVAKEDGSEMVFPQYGWNQYFGQWFKEIPDIGTYHHFRISSEKPGIVFAREFSASPEKEICILKYKSRGVPEINPTVLPEVVTPPGLSIQRQEYLYKHIRPYVRPELQDLVCPKPDIGDAEPVALQPPAKKRK